MYAFAPLNSRINGLNLTKFTHSVEKSVQLNLLKLELQYSNLFQNARAILPIFTLKLLAMATSLEQSEKAGRINNLQLNTYHMVKIGPVDPEIKGCKVGPQKKRNKEKTLAKHIARGAGMPH